MHRAGRNEARRRSIGGSGGCRGGARRGRSAGVNDGRLAETVELAAGDFGPLAGVVEFQVALPVMDGLEGFASALAEEGDVEMGVGVLRIEVEGLAVMVHRIGDAALLVI